MRRRSETDKTFTRDQMKRYGQMVSFLKERRIEIPIHHVSNSAGIVDLPGYNLDMVRAGIILYGLWPSDEVEKKNIDLKPLLSLRSHVAYVKDLEDGGTVSYGGIWQAHGTRRDRHHTGGIRGTAIPARFPTGAMC